MIKDSNGVLKAAVTYGLWSRFWAQQTGASSSATVDCGGVHGRRFDRTITVPSMSGCNQALLTNCDMSCGDANCTPHFCIEYTLGTLAISGNVFSAGVTMPIKKIGSVNVQTAALKPVLVVTTVLAATLPTITVTYTNQDGQSGRVTGTGTGSTPIILPTNAAVNSAFDIAPHLQSGDTGIQSVQDIDTSGGTSGALALMGLLPLAYNPAAKQHGPVHIPPLALSMPQYRVVTGDRLAMYIFGGFTPGNSINAKCGFAFAGEVG